MKLCDHPLAYNNAPITKYEPTADRLKSIIKAIGKQLDVLLTQIG